MSEVYASKRERLEKLYTLNTQVYVGPDLEDGAEPNSEDILYLKKLSVPQERFASTESYKVRAKYEILKKADPLDPERLAIREAVLLVEEVDQLALLVLSEEYTKLQASVESRIAHEEKWAQNDYLQTLQSLWIDEMKERFDRNPEDEEAARVFKELKKYTEEVDTIVQSEFEDMLFEKKQSSKDVLIEEAIDQLLDTSAVSAQVEEYNYWKIFFATYLDSDFTEKFFEEIDDVRGTPHELLSKILTAYDDMSIGVMRGKD